MKREGVSTLFIHGYPWALSYLVFQITCFAFAIVLNGALCGFEKYFVKEAIVLAIFVMILIRKNVYKDVCLLKNVSMF